MINFNYTKPDQENPNGNILPEIIIYESLNLNHEEKKKIQGWLSDKKYNSYESGWNTICYK